MGKISEGGEIMNIYIASSWKNRSQVNEVARKLRNMGHKVYDFTDPCCRSADGIPPEQYPKEFDPEKHQYSVYIHNPAWMSAVEEDFGAIQKAEIVVLLLPCGNDAHADFGAAIGMGKTTVVVGQPKKGERSPVHTWANRVLDTVDELYNYIKVKAIEKDYAFFI
jgi:hypothetical protein